MNRPTLLTSTQLPALRHQASASLHDLTYLHLHEAADDTPGMAVDILAIAVLRTTPMLTLVIGGAALRDADYTLTDTTTLTEATTRLLVRPDSVRLLHPSGTWVVHLRARDLYAQLDHYAHQHTDSSLSAEL